MAFPIVAVLGALLSDQQNRKAKSDAIRQAGTANTQNILRSQARALGGSPYTGNAEDLKRSFHEISQQAEAQRNNQIGSILQAYLSQPSNDERTIGGGIGAAGTPTVDDIGAGSVSSDRMLNDEFGGESTKLWEDDPWGSGVF